MEAVANIEERLNLITFGVVLDTNLPKADRWASLAEMHGEWLLDPKAAAYKSSAQIQAAMQQLRTGGAQHTGRVWWQICRGVQGRFKGSWRDLLNASNDDTQTLQRYLEQSQTTFPVLAGPVISVRWLDLIHRAVGVPLRGWEALTLPLPSHQKDAARKFGIETDVVHPAVCSALEVWMTACWGKTAETCGLKDCPEK